MIRVMRSFVQEQRSRNVSHRIAPLSVTTNRRNRKVKIPQRRERPKYEIVWEPR